MSNKYRKRELTEEQLDFFDNNGYLVVSNCIDETDRVQLVSDMWKLSGLKKNKPDTWDSTPTGLQKNGFLEMYHNPIQWKVRQDPRIYNIFADLFKNDELWVSIDRVNMKLPSKGNWISKGFTHWDFDPWDNSEYPLHLQGVIALEDTSLEMGGFHCVPGMHKFLKDWAATRPIEQCYRDKFYQSGIPIDVPKHYLSSIEKQDRPILMKAGDLVIFRGEIAHGNGENLSSVPRMAMYVTMFPADETQHEWIENHVAIYQKKLPGTQSPYPQLGWRVKKYRRFLEDQYHGEPPIELSQLCYKLIGKYSWCD